MPAPSSGQAAEAAACAFLQSQGLTLVTRNYRSPYGEIDLVLTQDTLLVFAEVRLRNHPGFGGAAASVTRAKQQKIIASAAAFLHHHPQFSRHDCRFDVLALRARHAGSTSSAPADWQIDWLAAAFTT